MTQPPADQWLRQALAASARGDHLAAIAAFEQASSRNPRDPELQSRLAAERLAFGDIAGARDAAETGRRLAGADAATLNRLGHVFSQTNDFALAAALFRLAAAAAPNDIGILRNLGWGEQYVGNFPAAEAALRRVLALNPRDDKAWFSLSGLGAWSPTAADIAALEVLLGQVADDPVASLGAGHALARARELTGDFPAALATLTRAKAARRRARPYDVQIALDAFAAAPPAWQTGPTGQGDASDAPIFVVGPPRSGTTLMDRILSSHAGVVSAGEPPAMPRLALRAAGMSDRAPMTAEVLRRGAGAPAGIIGATYLKAVSPLVGDAARFVDKRPFNLLMAGIISRSLPNARIVRMRRPAADTVVGNYRQFFGPGSPHHDYSYDLRDTALYIAGLETLSEAWERLLPPDRYRVIDYAELVADPEGQIRAVVDFCGLDWDPACLDFHNNAGGVSTASAVQVREPLHARNLGVWSRYGPGLEPALGVLRDAGRL